MFYFENLIILQRLIPDNRSLVVSNPEPSGGRLESYHCTVLAMQYLSLYISIIMSLSKGIINRKPDGVGLKKNQHAGLLLKENGMIKKKITRKVVSEPPNKDKGQLENNRKIL